MVLAEHEILGAAITASGLDVDGPVRIPVERYTSPEFAALEQSRLWPKVWLVACSVDHVAEPGDFYELRCGSFSVVIVRGEDGELRAFQNVCRHRGNSLCQGSGSGLSELRCGYHRWTWSLDGLLREVPSRKGFGVLRNDDFPLFRASVGAFGRLVFVNLDPDAMPLDEWLEGVPDDVAWAGLDTDYRCAYLTTTPVDANWKVVADGFSETYHIQGLHREMLGSMDDVDSAQRLWSRHGVSYQDYGVPSPRLGRDVSPEVVWDSFVLSQGGRMGPAYASPGVPMPPVPEGSTITDVIAALIRAHQASRGADLSRYDTGEMLRLSQYNLFPNSTLLVTPDLYTVLTARPGPTVDRAELVMLHFEPASAGAPARSQPMDVVVPADQTAFGFVLDADVRVLAGVQRGLQQPGMRELVLSREECRIVNMHRNLAQYVAG